MVENFGVIRWRARWPKSGDSFLLDLTEPDELRHVSALEFHQHVHVAVRAEIVTQDGTEKRELANTAAPAELGEFLLIHGKSGAHLVSF